MKTERLINFIIFIIITGLGGIFAQIILLREMLILFSGNELSIGVIIGSWVLWEAGGAYLAGKRRVVGRVAVKTLVFSTLTFSCLLPVAIYATRIYKIIAGIPPEIGTGILSIFLASFFILFPISFLHGMLFTLLCSYYDELTEDHSLSIGKVYFYEMLGTIIGGLLLNYFLIKFFNSFNTAVALSLINALTCILFVFSCYDGKKAGLYIGGIIIFFLSLTMIVGGVTDYLHDSSVRKQWMGRDIVHYKNSLYQNIVVAKDNEQFTFFANSVPVITTPNPDIGYVEDFVHITMLSHNRPEHVLVLSGGAGGVIHEILKYRSVKSIDYIESDPLFLKTIQSFSTSITERELKSPLVNLHFIDGRLFVKNPPTRYDVIFLGVPLPSTLQTNRFFTEEFFQLIKRALKPDGLLSFTLPATITYYSKELKNIHACILNTAKTVFDYDFIIPGDFNIFIFSNNMNLQNNNASVISERFKKAAIDTRLINITHLNSRLDIRKKGWYLSNLRGVSIEVNRDLSPFAFFYTIAYDNTIYSPYLKGFLYAIKGMTLFRVMFLSFFFFLVFVVLTMRKKATPIVYTIGSTGFTSMVIEIILILSFQIFYGYVFFEVGVLVTVFLFGLALGGIAVSTQYASRFNETKMLQVIDFAIVTLIVTVFFVLKYLCPYIQSHVFLVRALFFMLLFISGIFTGAEFPLGSRIFRAVHGKGDIGRTVGLLYGVDLIGGFVGGVLGGLLLSVIGILEGCIVLAFIKIGSLALLLTCKNKVLLS